MHRSRLQGVLAFLFWSIVFGISYTQAPLYYSNQNQYFLHGLAAAGQGDLDQDWLANTRDPTPLFSAVVALTAGYAHEWLFYGYYLLILGLYFYSLLGLFTWLAPEPPSQMVRLCFITVLVALHSGAVRLASARLLGVDYPWYFQAGVAGQYLLGFGLQPSVCGVFLLASLLMFLRGRPWLAVALACLGAVLHSTYLLTAGFLTLAYMMMQYRERGARCAILLGAFALALVLPTVIYNAVTFAPSSAADFAEAQHILAHVRIPHHAEVSRWLDAIAVGQMLWIVVALLLVRETKLFPVLAVLAGAALMLSLVQVVTGNNTLALLFPWRTSVVLVPIATAIILGRLVWKTRFWIERLAPGKLLTACSLVLAGCMLVGLAVPVFELGYRTNRDEEPVLAFIKAHHQRGDLFLIPVDLPKLGSGARGAFSTNFTPAPRKGSNLIAIDLQSFRLATGAPLYVDFKSIPYRDDEVLEWYRRVLQCKAAYDESTSARPIEVSNWGVTHVVMPTRSSRRFASLGPPLYADETYCVFEVRRKS